LSDTICGEIIRVAGT